MPEPTKQAQMNLRFGADLAKQIDDLVAELGLESLRWRQEIVRKSIEAGLPGVAASLRKAFGRKSA